MRPTRALILVALHSAYAFAPAIRVNAWGSRLSILKSSADVEKAVGATDDPQASEPDYFADAVEPAGANDETSDPASSAEPDVADTVEAVAADKEVSDHEPVAVEAIEAVKPAEDEPPEPKVAEPDVADTIEAVAADTEVPDAVPVAAETVEAVEPAEEEPPVPKVAPVASEIPEQDAPMLTAAEINERLQQALERLREKDRTSKALTKDDLKVAYEDDHIVVVDKPAGVLCVPGKDDNPSLNKAVFEAFGCESGRMDKMVVHRLGMDTSGLVVFARTEEALRGMNSLFRTRKVTRQYEALLCGNVEYDEGLIDRPLMRDYEHPPYMRVSTDAHQRALIGLDPAEVGKKFLELPKESLTKYEVTAREELGGHPVSRVTLTSISGRTHQLNVHCAAFGHPIVADSVYGIGGEAAANGGLDEKAMDVVAPNRANVELQKGIKDAAGDKSMCVHAKTISFRHPVTKEMVNLESAAPF